MKLDFYLKLEIVLFVAISDALLIFGYFFPQQIAIFLLMACIMLLMTVMVLHHRIKQQRHRADCLEVDKQSLEIQLQVMAANKQADDHLRQMAYHDPLTKLANRNHVEQFIQHHLQTIGQDTQEFAVLFLDLDRFKIINDTIGHDAGDILLKIIAERLRDSVRSADMVARLGGDEFVIIMSDVKKTELITEIANKILTNILKVIAINGHEIYITTSIGISLYPYDGQNMQALMKNADLAMYHAKEHGRNNYQFYTYEMTSRAQEKMALENALGHALAKKEFILNYQPKMNCNQQCVTGVEALLRWRNSDYGLISPSEIIALAEDTGLIIPVSEWILDTACDQLHKWHTMGYPTLSMSINCSLRQFKQATFVDDIKAVLTKYSIQPHLLEIEFTERTIMQDPDNMRNVLEALKALGVKLAIDNFGTGYWALNNLRKLSVDKIKIDKSFIRHVDTDHASADIARALITMVNKLGIISVAEGVETKAQYEFLKREGCTEIQGYYFSKPLTADNMTTFLASPKPQPEINSGKRLTDFN